MKICIKRIILHQSSASTLLYVIFVALLISLLLSSLILIEYLNFSKLNHYKKYISAIEKLELYKTLFQSSNFNSSIEEYSRLPLGENINVDDIQIKYLDWGLYKVGVCKHADLENRINLSKQYLIGNLIDSKCALYIANNSKAVVISGTTKIIGNIFIPLGYYKTGVVNSSEANTATPVEGLVKQSEELPKIDKELYVYIDKLCNGMQFKNDSISILNKAGNLTHSFCNRTMYVKSSSAITLDNIIMTGNIKLFSSKSITISRNCSLSDVMIIAPYIKVEEGFKGSCQLIATDSLIVEKNCIFDYPSVLLISSKKHSSSIMKIKEESEIDGDLVALKQIPDIKNIAFVSIEKEVKINGRIYCQDYLDNKGSVFGSIYTNKLFLNTGSAVNENYINSMKINSKDVPNPCTLGILFDNNQKSIIKCLP